MGKVESNIVSKAFEFKFIKFERSGTGVGVQGMRSRAVIIKKNSSENRNSLEDVKPTINIMLRRLVDSRGNIKATVGVEMTFTRGSREHGVHRE
jgi:hypothetical protein